MGTTPFLNEPPRRELVPRGRHIAEPPASAREISIPQQDYSTSAQPGESFLLDYWNTLRRHKLLMLFFAIGGAAVAVLVTMQLTPIYEARTTLELLSLNGNFLNMKSSDPTVDLPEYSADEILRTQVRIIQSNSLMKRVIPKLQAEPDTAPEPESSRLLAWKRALRLRQPTREERREQAIHYASENWNVTVPEETRIIEISCDSPDRQVATDFANFLASEYVEQNLESRWEMTQHTGEWLTKQMQGLKQKLEVSEDALQSYAQKNGLVFTGEKDSVAEDRLRQLQQELLRAQSDRVMKQSKYETSLTASAESLPEVLDDSSLRDFGGKLAELKRLRAELGATLTSAHPRVQKVDAQISEVLLGIERARANVIKRISAEYEGAQRRENLIRADYVSQTDLVNSQSAKGIHYEILKREVDTNRQLYDSMLQRVKEASIAAAMRASNARIVDRAEPPLLPYKPNPVRNGLLGLTSGFFLGILFVLFRDRMDSSIQSPGDVAIYLNLPEFGVIPSAQPETGHRLYYGAVHAAALLEADKGRNGNGRESLELARIRRAASPLAESFRSALTSVLFSNYEGKPPRLIVLSSAMAAEGKTTVLTNLGLAMTETRRRVLLIDADLRRPQLHTIFGIPNECGLREVLHSNEPIEIAAMRAAHATSTLNLFVMPSGSTPASISTLLHSSRLPQLLEHLEQQYDAILIDTPPMLQMPDARILGRLVDGVILVIRAGKTTRDTARMASQRFLEDGIPVLGTILNDWNPKHKAMHGYGYYGSHYDDYHNTNGE
jgi:succinoglycan biosynthesis transport protein ExoP